MYLETSSDKKVINKNLKIALLSQEFSKNCGGGICRYMYDLCHGLAELGHEIHIITKSKKPSLCKNRNIYIHEIDLMPVDFLDLSMNMDISKKNLAYSYSACLKLLEIIDDFGIQIVEVPLWDAEGFVFSLVKNVPLVVRIETPLFKVADIQGWEITGDLKLANWMEGETARRADKVIAISNNIGNLIADHHGISRNDMVYCPLGITIPDENLLQSNRAEEYFDILYVGRLEKRKGIDVLFEAMPLIIEAIPNARFNIVGKDTNLSPNEQSYKEFLHKSLEYKYRQNVRFFGYVANSKLNKFYKECNVFVAPSLYESFGLIYLEAMAWGKPVIGCDVGGVPEIIQDGESGLLIEPDNEKALSDAIIKLKDDRIRKKLGKNARNRVKSEFSKNKFIDKTILIYENLLEFKK